MDMPLGEAGKIVPEPKPGVGNLFFEDAFHFYFLLRGLKMPLSCPGCNRLSVNRFQGRAQEFKRGGEPQFEAVRFPPKVK